MIPFSANKREELIDTMLETSFDLIVIGGGITGAGIALDASTRGLRTLLLEKNDFAWGTSSRSTKLIHGGLRYLKQFEFGLVHEVGVERAIVHKNAPHVVIPEKMLLPIIEDGSLGKTLSSIGLWVYDRLANVDVDERRKMIDKEDVETLEPLLRKDILLGGGLYYEYRTDDARLTIENIKSAHENGAICLNHMEVTQFTYRDNGYINGLHVKDTLNNQNYVIRSRRIVNATGPWVDTLRSKDPEGIVGKKLRLTKGVHLVIDRKKLPLTQSIYFDVKNDSRMVFAIPRGNITYIGTTDTVYDKLIDTPTTNREDIDYILEATNYMFPSAKLNASDVQSTWAGLRPLIHQDGKSPSELSRKDEIFYAKSGLISIAGGKLTGYRKMAERVMNFVCKTIRDTSFSPCKTKDICLTGGDFESADAVENYIQKCSGECKQVHMEEHYIRQLVYRYGSNTDRIIHRIFENYQEATNKEHCYLEAELWYCMEHEMTLTLCDFAIRRTGRLYFDRPQLEKNYEFMANCMAEHIGWDEKRKLIELEAFKTEFKAVMNF